MHLLDSKLRKKILESVCNNTYLKSDDQVKRNYQTRIREKSVNSWTEKLKYLIIGRKMENTKKHLTGQNVPCDDGSVEKKTVAVHAPRLKHVFLISEKAEKCVFSAAKQGKSILDSTDMYMSLFQKSIHGDLSSAHTRSICILLITDMQMQKSKTEALYCPRCRYTFLILEIQRVVLLSQILVQINILISTELPLGNSDSFTEFTLYIDTYSANMWRLHGIVHVLAKKGTIFLHVKYLLQSFLASIEHFNSLSIKSGECSQEPYQCLPVKRKTPAVSHFITVPVCGVQFVQIRSKNQCTVIESESDKEDNGDSAAKVFCLSNKRNASVSKPQLLCKTHTVDLDFEKSSSSNKQTFKSDSDSNDIKRTLRQNTSCDLNYTQKLMVYPAGRQTAGDQSDSIQTDSISYHPYEVSNSETAIDGSDVSSEIPPVVRAGRDCFEGLDNFRHKQNRGADSADSISCQGTTSPSNLESQHKEDEEVSDNKGACGGQTVVDIDESSQKTSDEVVSAECTGFEDTALPSNVEKERNMFENTTVGSASGEQALAVCSDHDTVSMSVEESHRDQYSLDNDRELFASSSSTASQGTGQAEVSASSTHSSVPVTDESDVPRFEPLMAVIDRLARGERVPPQETMRYEMLRFCTLRSFPRENKPFITRIAQAGFYYANTGDEVVCYTCAKRKNNWTENDIPLEVHKQLNPNCAFLLRNSEVNVPRDKQNLVGSRRSVTAPGSSVFVRDNLVTATLASKSRSGVHGNRFQGTRNLFSGSSSSNTRTGRPTQQSSPAVEGSISSQPTCSVGEGFASRQTNIGSTSNRAHGNFASSSLAGPTNSVASLSTVSMSTPVTSSIAMHSSSLAGPVSVSVVSSVGPPNASIASQNGLSVTSNNTASTVTRTVTTNSSARSSQVTSGNTSSTPKYPAYASESSRLASFQDCSDLLLSAESLAEAGFFSAGFGDCCRCFHCGVGLRHWSPEDDPWIEHSRWSRNCAFVKAKKGEEFVNLVQMAVEYQQNQRQQQQASSNETTGSTDEAALDNLLHTDAAQSILEMGYTPDVIRRALRDVLANTGQSNITASMLMEKIFSYEESTSVTRPQISGGPDNNQPSLSAEQAIARPVQKESTEEGATANTAISKSKTLSKREQVLQHKRLKDENARMKMQSICTKCKERDVCIVFLPCGHLVTCEQCAETVRYCNVRNCGKYIKGTVRTYVS